MASFSQDLTLQTYGTLPEDSLTRAVLVSLFTWRRAAADDKHDGQRWGWWGDNLAQEATDQIGSRLWLLAREKLTTQTLNRARDYATEALAWLVKDGVASRYEVEVERIGLDFMAIAVRVYRTDGTVRDLRFENAWSLINV